MKVIFTLVHGTWARGATYPELAAALRATPDSEVHSLQWPGRNTVAARRAGSKRLVAHIAEVAARFPAASHFVVGHSHGGSVALQALADPETPARVSGVVCLSTPFVFVERRRISAAARELATLAALFGPAVVPMVLYGTVYGFDQVPDEPTLGIMVLWVLSAALTWVLIRRTADDIDTFIAASQRPPAMKTPLLIVRSTGDEASSALAAVQFTTWLLDRLWWFLTEGWFQVVIGTIRAKFGDIWLRRLARMYVSLIVAAALFWLLSFLDAAPDAVIPVVVTPLIIAIIAVPGLVLYLWIVAGLVMIPALFVNALALLPFGPEFAIRAAYLKVSVESTPPGTWVVHQFTGQPDGGLQHSASHRDQLAIAEIVSFVTRTIDGRAEGRTP